MNNMEIPKGYREAHRADNVTHILTMNGVLPCEYSNGVARIGDSKIGFAYLTSREMGMVGIIPLCKIPKTPRVWQWVGDSGLNLNIPPGVRAKWVVTEILEDED